MRLLSFDLNGAPTAGVRLGDEVIDLGVAAPDLPRDLRGLLAAGPQALAAAERAAAAAPGHARHPLESVRHLVPIPRPDKIIGLGKTYMKHVAEMNAEASTFPGMFLRAPDSMVAHNRPIWRPEVSDTLDYEGELMVVIGRGGWMIPRESALEHVAGYACHNDGSVRAYNYIPSAVTAGKNFLNTGGLGPEIVTADELPPGCKGLRLTTHVNGELRQSADIAEMHWDVAHLVHLMSTIFTLYPGDLIATGTPSGCAAAAASPQWLTPGDVVRVEIEGVGTLVNPIVDAPRAGAGDQS
ncbi:MULTISPECIES: fumarylacetoacetate hydrolase family protein [unclassified Caulobacter]|jgi:2-keto-4-pentenoate hydratase/2-oxohepta-3-ene-1,7-dioic acid hydratase in catechol pathway|uniref:fumarylacetoacetate hydrolase family protein n=1 Tax=unclassified Caulobacter TaxID=2648921 RepID=UPI0007864490|nr:MULTISPECIES: fumarylacetoacetate hydrolase family protein [unclassified Caulobacter]AZS19297.1 FAA hydrolase family protein [Caulobacter sp. FWC26]